MYINHSLNSVDSNHQQEWKSNNSTAFVNDNFKGDGRESTEESRNTSRFQVSSVNEERNDINNATMIILQMIHSAVTFEIWQNLELKFENWS